MKRNILLLLSLCMLLLTCSDSNDPIKEIEKPKEENPFITLKKANIDFTNDGGSESILIESNVTWTTKSSAGWCTVTPSSGNKSTESITIAATENKEYDNRSCTVTLESGNISKTITVNQGENLGLLITQDRYELGNEESTIKVEVKANVDFEVEINDEWITQVETRGLTTSELAFKIAKNDSYDNREGSITIKQKGGSMSSTITIFQSQEDAIILSEKEFDLSSEAQAVEVEIKTNIDYEIIIPEDAKDWVSHSTTRALRTETVVLDIAQNKDYDERTAKIVVKDKKTNLQETVTIKQAANTGLIVNEDKYEVSNEGEIIEVEIKANVNFKVDISESWITQVETRGLVVTKLQFEVHKNKGYDAREATITIFQTDGNLKSSIKVYQSQKDAIIISEKTVNLSNEKQAIDVELKTNVDFEVIISDGGKKWVSYTPTRGLRTETLTLNISENKDYTARNTEVYVKNKKTNLQDTLTINQASNTGLIISEDKYELSNDGGTIEIEVKANVEFDIEIADSWITRVETRGLTVTKLQFQVAKNESYDNREGTITIKQKDGNLSSTIKVYQSQKDAIIISEKTFDLSREKQAIEVELKTNVEFEVIIPEAAKSWVSYTPTRGLRTETLTLNISENKDYTGRNTEVYVKDKKTNLQDTLTINQAANTGLIVSEDKYELSNDGGTIEVEVKANFDYKVTISDNWITQVETRGLTTTNLTFAVAKNESYSNREATITISQIDGDLSSTITVYQSQKNAIILSEKNYNLSRENHTLKIELKTNVDFEVNIPVESKSWVSYTPTRGLRTETLILNISENKDYGTRITEVYIKDKETKLQETITISQEGVVVDEIWVDKMGTLGKILSAEQKNSIEAMIVKGEINKADFNVMKLEMPKLKYVDLKEVKCEDDKIPDEAFEYEYKISTIILPENITAIGVKAFYNCTGLTGDLIIPDGVTTIEAAAFQSCSGFTGNLILPDGLTKIEGRAFSSCSGFTGNLNLPNKLNSLGREAFANCSGFTGSLILPNGLKVIEDRAFIYCSGFSGSLTLPEELKVIENFAFNGCSGFTGSLNFPDGLTTIGMQAFWSCSGFTGPLNLPDRLTIIKTLAFYKCSGFTGSLILPDGLKTVMESAFWFCSGFTGSLILPESLTTIGGNAFAECSGFTGPLILPNKLTEIQSSTFSNCSGFTGDLTIPNGVTAIGRTAFTGCSGLSGNLIIPDGVKIIGKSAFDRCYGLTGLTLGKSVTTINESAFYGCSNITGDVIFPASLTSTRIESFYGCNKVEAFQFPHTRPLGYYPNMLPSGATVKVPTEAVATYKGTNGWKDYNIVGY